MGSTAVSSGEAIALTGAILGHSNLRSTGIDAHVQADPSRRAANGVTKKIAATPAGKPGSAVSNKGRSEAKRAPDSDDDLVRVLAERLSGKGPKAARLRTAVSVAINQSLDTDERRVTASALMATAARAD